MATMSLALHQFDTVSRTDILAEALRVAPKLIIADYANPITSSFLRTGVHVAERIAGKEHFQNFNSFRHEGGTINNFRKSQLPCKPFRIVGQRGILSSGH